MPDLDQLLLALLGGLGFGFLVWHIGSTWQRLAVMLFLLWIMQSLSQQLLRALDGRDVSNEVVLVSIVRLVFGVGAVSMVWGLDWWDRRKGGRSE